MARKVFFSFHYQRDIWRVSQVRNCNVITSTYQKNDFLDAVSWEQVIRQGEQAIKNWIDNQLKGTSVTIVLIGNQTSQRKYVHYEIEQSYKKGNGLVGIYIHTIKNKDGQTDFIGANPLATWHIKDGNNIRFFTDIFKTYYWDWDNGRSNIGLWIEETAKIVGR